MKTLLIIVSLLGLLACKGPTVPDCPEVPEILDTLSYSLDEDIGMMLLVGFRGTEVDPKGNSDIAVALRDYHVGSVILFDYDAVTGRRGRNIKSPSQVIFLCDQLRALNPNLLIGIDQEGGYVSRLHPRYGFPKILSAQQCAAYGNDTLRHYARLTAQTLNVLGINLNFAPVADVNVNPKCPVIGGIERSFSSDPARVGECCRLWIEEQRKSNVISCLKHFPGHGSATGDTHKGLVDVSSTWQRSELEPYRGLDSLGTMVMTAHVVNRQLDPSGMPASLSPVITSYLRDTLGFQGVIITDDLAMGAIVNEYSFEEAVRLAVLAGADMLCLSNNGGTYDLDMVPRAVSVIRRMVAEGEVSVDRIHQSASRVRALAQ